MEKGFVVWFTGLPSSGKTSVARKLEEMLIQEALMVEVLDGDELRTKLDPEVGFSRRDREVHIRRVAYVSKLLARNGVAVLVCLVSPYRHVRANARKEIGDFIEVWTKCSLETCIKRDPKGLYKKALAGEIADMTGIQDPYEEPLNPEVIVETEGKTAKENAKKVLEKLKELGYVTNKRSE